jgi:hypothetical protein
MLLYHLLNILRIVLIASEPNGSCRYGQSPSRYFYTYNTILHMGLEAICYTRIHLPEQESKHKTHASTTRNSVSMFPPPASGQILIISLF